MSLQLKLASSNLVEAQTASDDLDNLFNQKVLKEFLVMMNIKKNLKKIKKIKA